MPGLSLRERRRLVREFVASHAAVHDPAVRTAADVCIALFLGLAAAILLVGSGVVDPGAAGAAAAMVLLAAVLGSQRLRGAIVAAGSAGAGVRIARAWYPFLLVPLLYAVIPALNLRIHAGRYFDAELQAAEARLFGGQPAARFAELLPLQWISEPLHAAYLSYYVLIWLPALLCYLRGRMDGFSAARDAFVAASLTCFVFFVFLPVQGPRYLWPPPALEALGDGALHSLTHAILERGSSRGAAFPSGHVAVAVAQSVVAWRYLGRHRVWITATTVLLAVATVYGGFHYAVDVIAGAAVGGATGIVAVRRAGGRSDGAGVTGGK